MKAVSEILSFAFVLALGVGVFRACVSTPEEERRCRVEAYDACVKNTSDSTDCLRQMRAVCDVEAAQ